MGGASVLLGPAHTELMLTRSEGLNSQSAVSIAANVPLGAYNISFTCGLVLSQLIMQVIVMSYFGKHTKDWF